MKKKLLLVILAAILVFAATACNGPKKGTDWNKGVWSNEVEF